MAYTRFQIFAFALSTAHPQAARARIDAFLDVDCQAKYCPSYVSHSPHPQECADARRDFINEMVDICNPVGGRLMHLMPRPQDLDKMREIVTKIIDAEMSNLDEIIGYDFVKVLFGGSDPEAVPYWWSGFKIARDATRRADLFKFGNAAAIAQGARNGYMDWQCAYNNNDSMQAILRHFKTKCPEGASGPNGHGGGFLKVHSILFSRAALTNLRARHRRPVWIVGRGWEENAIIGLTTKASDPNRDPDTWGWVEDSYFYTSEILELVHMDMHQLLKINTTDRKNCPDILASLNRIPQIQAKGLIPDEACDDAFW